MAAKTTCPKCLAESGSRDGDPLSAHTRAARCAAPIVSSRFVGDLTRSEFLEELATYRDDDGLDHVTGPDDEPIEDPATLDDETLRELLKLARLRALLWRQQDE